MRRYVLFTLLCTLSLDAHAAQSNGPAVEVVLSGLSITGDCGGENSTAPVIAQLLCEEEFVTPRNIRLRAEIESLSPQWIRLAAPDKQAKSDGTTTQVVVAAAVDRESTSVEKIGDKFKVVTEIAAQALFFDFKSKEVLGSVPVNVEYIDVLQVEPDVATRAQMLRTLLDKPGEFGLISALAEAIAGARPSSNAKHRMQLSEISYSDGVFADHHPVERKLRAGVAGREFSKFFSAGTGLALLPFVLSGAYENKEGAALIRAVKLSFADASQLALTIPDPDFSIRVNVDRVVQQTASKNAVVEQRLYGVFFTISVTEPQFGKSYFRQPLKHGAFKTIPATQTDVDDATALYATMLEGFAYFARATQGKANNWISDQPGGRSARSEWSVLRKMIEDCR